MKPSQKTPHKPLLGLILLAYAAFIALGMPDGLLGIAWPSMRTRFGVPLDALGILLFAGTSGYLVSSFFSGKLISWMGVGRLLVSSCMLTGAALIGYALVPHWWMLTFLGIFSGLGAGAIDAGLNTYVAENFNEGLMQWLHASYGAGVMLGPLIMTYALTTLNSWRPGYWIVGGVQLLMATAFIVTLPLWKHKTDSPDEPHQTRVNGYKTPFGETLLQPRVWLSMFIFFLYVGAEVALGAWTYTLLTESRGIPTTSAGFWAGSYWVTFMIGRILAGLYTRRIGNSTLVLVSLACALAGTALLWWNPAGWANLAAVALVGFAIAPIFPALVSSTSQRVGARYTANTIGMQMAMGGLGGSLVTGLVGILAKNLGLEVIPVCLVGVFGILTGLFVLSIKSSPETSR